MHPEHPAPPIEKRWFPITSGKRAMPACRILANDGCFLGVLMAGEMPISPDGEKNFIQIRRFGVYPCETVTGREQFVWCEALYEAKAAELILYGRALGLGHGEAEDVLQETFLALMRLPQQSAGAGALLCAQFSEPRAEPSPLVVAPADAGTGIVALVRKVAGRKRGGTRGDELPGRIAGGTARGDSAENLAPVHV